ncbi:MAG: RluA family pseudouridine synthase [Alphaproteobacteria bacterium]
MTAVPEKDKGTARRHRLRSDSADNGARLDRFLAARLPELSRSRLKSLILDGRLRADGETITDPSYRVKPGQTFALIIPETVPARPQGQAIPLHVVFEDADLIVIDKPAGLVVHPAPGNPDRTLVNALIHHCGDSLSGIGGERRPGIVHRLDKDTTGLMVAAKNDRAHAGLAAQFAARDIRRAYHAVAWGAPSPPQGEIDAPIGRSPANRKKMAVRARGGRAALTRYRLLRRIGGLASLVECRLATGRTHQIRVHMASIGHPIVGDPVYGRGRGARAGAPGSPARVAAKALGRQALHASLLGFLHPVIEKPFTFESPLPNDINELIDRLEAV